MPRECRASGLVRVLREAFSSLPFEAFELNRYCSVFYWDELNQKGDLSWQEIVKLSENSPPFTDLWFSGGEPTLRKELAGIIDLFVQNNGVHYINLPTNGLKP